MRPVGRHLRLIAAAATTLLLTACAPQASSEQGEIIATQYNVVLAMSLVIGIAVIGMILLSAVRFRKKPGDDTLPPQTHGNTTFEVIWTAVPTVIVLALFAMSFVNIRAIDKPGKNFAAIIEVKGYQWSWTFDYGKNAAGTRVLVKTDKNTDPPQLIVPVGETVHIEERSDNVLHSFYVPAFLFKRDVVPGKANGFDLTVTSPGIYKGQCAELCGTEHAKMTFTVKAVGRAEFDKWFNEFVPPRPKCEETGKASDRVVINSVPNASEFVEKCAYAKAGVPVTIEFVNGGGLQHNVAVVKGTEVGDTGALLGKPGPFVDGAGEKSLTTMPAQPAGDDYTFFCQVHPLMQGRYVVQEAP